MSLAEGNGVSGAEPEVVDFALQAVVYAVESIDLLGQLRPGAKCFLPISELVGLGRKADVRVGPDGAVLRTAELRGHKVISSLVQQPVVLLEFVVLLAVLVDESVDEVKLLLQLAHSE